MHNIQKDNEPHAALPGAVLALDMGGTHLRYAVSHSVQDLSEQLEVQRERSDPKDPLEQLRRVVEGVHALTPLTQVIIGLPGVVHAGQIYAAPNLTALQDPAALPTLRGALPCPVTVMNDCNLAALGEAQDGTDDLVFIAIGTGLGCGLMRGGAVMAGEHGQAGELGLLPLPDGNVLEDLLSGPGLQGRYARYGGTTDPLTDECEAGQCTRTDLVQALEYLLQVVSLSFDPRRIVFGGGLGMHLGPLVDTAWQSVQTRLNHIPRPTLSGHGEHAALIGGLRLGWQNLGAGYG